MLSPVTFIIFLARTLQFQPMPLLPPSSLPPGIPVWPTPKPPHSPQKPTPHPSPPISATGYLTQHPTVNYNIDCANLSLEEIAKVKNLLAEIPTFCRKLPGQNWLDKSRHPYHSHKMRRPSSHPPTISSLPRSPGGNQPPSGQTGRSGYSRTLWPRHLILPRPVSGKERWFKAICSWFLCCQRPVKCPTSPNGPLGGMSGSDWDWQSQILYLAAYDQWVFSSWPWWSFSWIYGIPDFPQQIQL